ncbi:MAG: SPASM domain-containing protein [Cyanobacteria bacterium SIG29]|nr:SPASM domain-containing protein [Cyanobacteria bacterium SIG29]
MNIIKFLKFKFFKNKFEFVCPGAFSQVYIYHDGSVYFCPDCMMKKEAKIGNLNDNSFEEIWNSKHAQKIRKEILNKRYNYCFPPICYSKSNYNIRLVPKNGVEYTTVQKSFPKMVCLGPDWECNVNCVMCRDELCRYNDEDLKNFNDKIDKVYMPILKDAEVLTLSTTGDPFASRNTRLLMTTAANMYPNLKFSLITNGILCDEFNCRETGILNRMSRVMVSVHASNEETYNKVVKNGNYKKVLENIKWLSKMRDERKIDGLFLAFVVSAKNYDDIPNFIEFAKQNNVVALFWSCYSWDNNLSYSDEPLEITEPSHPKHQQFLDVLNSVELETPYSRFSPKLLYLKKHSKNK